jgi:hypothetical protein
VAVGKLLHQSRHHRRRRRRHYRPLHCLRLAATGRLVVAVAVAVRELVVAEVLVLRRRCRAARRYRGTLPLCSTAPYCAFCSVRLLAASAAAHHRCLFVLAAVE